MWDSNFNGSEAKKQYGFNPHSREGVIMAAVPGYAEAQPISKGQLN